MQPIETAPKDGTDILLVTSAGMAICRWLDSGFGGDGAVTDPQSPGWYVIVENTTVDAAGWDTTSGAILQPHGEMLGWYPLPTGAAE